MLGWDIFVTAINSDGKKETLCGWSAGLLGCQWLDDLVKQGIAKSLGGNGYPNRYELPLSVLLNRITPTPPADNSPTVIGDDYISDGSISNFKFYDDVALAIDSTTMVEVEAWDQS